MPHRLVESCWLARPRHSSSVSNLAKHLAAVLSALSQPLLLTLAEKALYGHSGTMLQDCSGRHSNKVRYKVLIRSFKYAGFGSGNVYLCTEAKGLQLYQSTQVECCPDCLASVASARVPMQISACADCVLISIMSDSGPHENTDFSCHLSI